MIQDNTTHLYNHHNVATKYNMMKLSQTLPQRPYHLITKFLSQKEIARANVLIKMVHYGSQHKA